MLESFQNPYNHPNSPTKTQIIVTLENVTLLIISNVHSRWEKDKLLVNKKKNSYFKRNILLGIIMEKKQRRKKQFLDTKRKVASIF